MGHNLVFFMAYIPMQQRDRPPCSILMLCGCVFSLLHAIRALMHRGSSSHTTTARNFQSHLCFVCFIHPYEVKEKKMVDLITVKNEQVLRDAIDWVGHLNDETPCTICAVSPPPTSWVPFAIWGAIATLVCIILLVLMSWARGWRQPFGKCPQMDLTHNLLVHET